VPKKLLWLTIFWGATATAQMDDVEWSLRVQDALQELRQNTGTPPINNKFYFGFRRNGGEVVPIGEYTDKGGWRLIWPLPKTNAAPPKDLFLNQTWFSKNGKSLILQQFMPYKSNCGTLFGYKTLSHVQYRGLVFSRRLQLPHVYQLQQRNINVDAILHKAGLQDRLGGDYVHHQRLGYINTTEKIFAVIYIHTIMGGQIGIWEIHPRRGRQIINFNLC